MRDLTLIALMLVVAALRVAGVLPPNVSPVAAIALFGGAMFAQRWMAVAVPFGIMLVSDLFIGFHPSMWAVYLGLAATVGIGRLVGPHSGMVKAMGGALVASVLFFLLTNAASWLDIPQYTKDLSGLMQAYAAGVPFYRNSLLGDLFFSLALFGAWHLAERKVPQLARA